VRQRFGGFGEVEIFSHGWWAEPHVALTRF